MTTITKAQELLLQIEKQIENAPTGEINGENVNTDMLEDAAGYLQEVIASLQAYQERMEGIGVNTDFAEHNVWNFAQTGVRA